MGNDYKALLKSYINQTGKIPMIPKWALGLWMSKCSYQTQDEIYEVVKISKERDIKIDVIHIDGWQKEGDAGAWVWDYERFPNPEEMIYKLKKEGIHLCLWIFPYIDENSKYFKEAEEKGFLVKNTKGVTSRFYSTATSTSKVGCFDFTNPHFIEWYKPKVRSVVSMGIGAVKTDFSEAVPEDAVYFDGSTGIQGHNKLTFLYAKTIYDIMAEVKIPLGELPMLWGRSGYAGSHTIPAAWAGDSSTHLNNHACILRGGLSASMSGIPFWGFDMGGFYNTDHEGYECVPTDEEYIRSCQFGFFNSLSRCHGKTPREPWNFGEKAEKIFKKFNDIRHLLLPYLYSTTYKTHLSDIPVIRPVVMEYPEDRSARNVELEYFLGDSLLVVPVFDQEDEIDVYLPNGQWIDLFTHERIKGGRWVKRKIELDSYLGGQYLSLSCADFAEMYTGHHLWNNYRVTAVLKPVTGTEHFVNIRVQGAMRSYAAGFSKNNKLVLRKNYYGYTTLCETDFEWKVDEEYKISLTADGSTISVSVNDKEYLKFTDSDLPLLTGCAGISVEKGSHCLYRDIAITGRE